MYAIQLVYLYNRAMVFKVSVSQGSEDFKLRLEKKLFRAIKKLYKLMIILCPFNILLLLAFGYKIRLPTMLLCQAFV